MERTLTRASASQPGSAVMMLKRIVFLILSNWIWFLICLALSMGIAFLYIKKTPPVYSRTVSILIKPGNNGAGDDVLRELGVSQTPANITNEILTLNSSQTATEIVRRLNLDVNYLRDAPFYKRTVYGVALPLYVRGAVTGFCAAFFNTLFFMSLLVLFFGSTEKLAGPIAEKGVFLYIITSVGINAVVEMAVAALVTGAAGVALKKARMI